MESDIESKGRFEDLGITKPFLLEALSYFNFISPTPVQNLTIPLAISSHDLIVQGKNGTGKTLAFSSAILETLETTETIPRVIIATATREVAIQIYDFINELVYSSQPSIYTALCCGGFNAKDNVNALKQGVHIVVGTEGRIKDMIERKALKLDGLRCIVLDEADKIVEFGRWIVNRVTNKPQILAFSATYSEESLKNLNSFMGDSKFIKCYGDDMKLKQLLEYYVRVEPNPDSVIETLIKLLNDLPYHQCIIFLNNRSKFEEILPKIRNSGFKCLSISGSMSQEQRLEVIRALRFMGIRIVLSTDLTSRGLDVLNVNLVINLDLPKDQHTYLHRVGRAGRYGTPGIAVTFIHQDSDLNKLNTFTSAFPISTFNKDLYTPREITHEEQAVLQELALPIIQPQDTSLPYPEDNTAAPDLQNLEWVDVPPEESPSLRFTVPIDIETLKQYSCPLCEIGRYGLHCHCQTCVGNYYFIVKYLN